MPLTSSISTCYSCQMLSPATGSQCSFNQSVIQSINQSVSHSVSQPFSHSASQSITVSTTIASGFLASTFHRVNSALNGSPRHRNKSPTRNSAVATLAGIAAAAVTTATTAIGDIYCDLDGSQKA